MKSTFLPGPESLSKAWIRQLLTPRKRQPPYRHAPATGIRRFNLIDCAPGDFVLDGDTPRQQLPEGMKLENLTWMSNGFRTVRAWTRTA